MKIRIIIVLVFVFGLIIEQGCNTKVNTIPFYQISDEFKSYCLFEPGSSWEYESSLLSQHVAVSVNGIQENIWTNTYNEEYSYEAVDMFVADNDIGISMIELTAGSTLNSTSNMNSQMWMFYDDGDYRLVFAPKFPLGEEQLLGEHEGYYTNIEILPTMQIGENTYSDVWHTQVIDHFELGFGNFDFYIAKNYGLVKIQNIIGSDTIITQLVNSSLVQ